MDIAKLNGAWTGTYRYGDCYPASYHNKVIPFSVEMNFTGNTFKGTCNDEYTEAQFNNHPAILEGTFVPNYISFIKRYPGLLVINEVEEIVAVPKTTSLDIHYTGMLFKAFFSKRIYFEGEWSMTDCFITEYGEKLFSTWYGTWKLEK